jgi:uncharacterized protein (TIGR02147 family)
MDVFAYTNYQKYLQALTSGAKATKSVSELAELSGVQRSYFSNVLAGRANLNTDQGFRLSQGLHHNEAEQEYFLALIEYERASSTAYRVHLKAKLTASQTKNRSLTEKLTRETPPVDASVLLEYFSAWEYVAIHTLVSIPKFQTLEEISNALGLTIPYTETIIHKLEQWGLVRKVQGRYRWQAGNMHIPHDSPAILLYHREWREKALENARRVREKEVHFTSVYSVSEDDFEEMRTQILEFIKQYSQKAGESKEQNLVVMNLDHFKLV